MFDLRISVDTLSFDFSRYTKTARALALRGVRNAARAFIAAALRNVPRDTGMAAGTFLNLSRNLQLGLSFAGGRSGLFYYANGLKLPKTPESGASLATQRSDIFTVDGDTILFHYGNDVLHYNINEFYPVIRGAPWFSYDAGEAAFMDYMRTKFLKDLPKVKDFITVTTITGGPNGLKTTTRKFSRSTNTGES